MLRNNFQSAYLPAQDVSVDEFLTLWKGYLSLKQYILLKAAKFGIKTFEVCDSSSRYLWNFFACTGAGSDIITGIDVPYNLQDCSQSHGAFRQARLHVLDGRLLQFTVSV
jgi:hypothetical protein